MGLVKNWLRRRAAKRMANRLAAELSESYLKGDVYTPPQIRSAYARLKLQPKYIDLAFAQFLEFETYFELTRGTRAEYDADRALYRRHQPDGYGRSSEPTPLNRYVSQSGGFDR